MWSFQDFLTLLDLLEPLKINYSNKIIVMLWSLVLKCRLSGRWAAQAYVLQ